MTCLRVEMLPDRIYSLDGRTLTTLCSDILPRIHQHITKLTVDQSSINAVFRATNYSKLRSLSLLDLDEAYAFDLVQGVGVLGDLLREQITSLSIDMKHQFTDELTTQFYSTMFHSLLKLCQRLTKFHFCSSAYDSHRRAVEFSALNCRSAILTELNVAGASFEECVHLFDGHFPSLSTVIINVRRVDRVPLRLTKLQPMYDLKRFSMFSFARSAHFDDAIVPVLQRMINLERLSLSLAVIRIDSDYVDGTQLYDDVLRYMPRLNKFTFNIETTVVKFRSDLLLSSNDDVQRSFAERPFGAVGSHVDVFVQEDGSRAHAYSLAQHFYSRCHVYSLPYNFTDFPFLSQPIRNGTYDRVRCLSVTDIRPFQYEFFRLIARSFPVLCSLFIINEHPQVNDQSTRMLLTFAGLRHLYLALTHLDYSILFLNSEHCHLPRLQKLSINWASLVSVTQDFTNEATRLTCSRVTQLRTPEAFVRPERFNSYFPLL